MIIRSKLSWGAVAWISPVRDVYELWTLAYLTSKILLFLLTMIIWWYKLPLYIVCLNINQAPVLETSSTHVKIMQSILWNKDHWKDSFHFLMTWIYFPYPEVKESTKFLRKRNHYFFTKHRWIMTYFIHGWVLEKIGNIVLENNLEMCVRHKLGHYYSSWGIYSMETKRKCT